MLTVVIFDVGNGNCALVVDEYGNSLMIDCGCHAEKSNPVDWILYQRWPGRLLGQMGYFREYQGGPCFPLTKLVISHPDLDHIKNAKRIAANLMPFLIESRQIEFFPQKLLATDSHDFKDYKASFCGPEWVSSAITPNWGFAYRSYCIPMYDLYRDSNFPEKSFKNNASIVCVVEFAGRKFLFGGDMEKIGWDWLIANNRKFYRDMAGGVDVLVAAHHGHRSGYSPKFINLIGTSRLTVLSKGSETNSQTDVDTRYSFESNGLVFWDIFNRCFIKKKSLSTRSNGNIIFQIFENGMPYYKGQLNVFTEC